MRRVIMALSIIAASSLGAEAATLSTTTGDVLVNTGSGFSRAVQGQELKPGDRVMVGRAGGGATISYDLSCLERVQIGLVVTVQAGVPCNAPGATTTTAPLGAGLAPEVAILGAAAAIGGGVLIYNATRSSSP
ncbi:MAG: hypothetical protein ABL907_19020 [Hyphomicrobium sp.]